MARSPAAVHSFVDQRGTQDISDEESTQSRAALGIRDGASFIVDIIEAYRVTVHRCATFGEQKMNRDCSVGETEASPDTAGAHILHRQPANPPGGKHSGRAGGSGGGSTWSLWSLSPVGAKRILWCFNSHLFHMPGHLPERRRRVGGSSDKYYSISASFVKSVRLLEK